MTKKTNCDGCTSLNDKGECVRAITPLRRTERVPECFTAEPSSLAAKYYDGAKAGYEAIDAAIAALKSNGFADEQPLLAALSKGVSPHITDKSEPNLHPLAGFLAGAANRIRLELAALSQSQPENDHQGDKNESDHTIA